MTVRLSRVLGNRFVLAPVVVLLVAGCVAGVLTGAFSSAARGGLYATGLLSDGGSSTLPPGALEHPTTPKATAPAPEPEPETPGAPAPVLKPAVPGPQPKAKRVSAKLNAVRGLTGSVSGAVVDVGTGKVLYGKNAKKGYIPASTMKLITSTAALSVLGPQHQFSTGVVRSGNRLTLVGGGDPYLMKTSSKAEPGRASLSQLARATATRLKKDRVTKVRLGYDVSLFSGPGWHPDWPAMYRDQVTPITPLWINEGRVAGAVGARVANPSKTAADAFANALEARGIRVTGVHKVKAERDAVKVAAVKSLPLDRIVERLLMVSDNDAAEVVARQAALGAKKPGSFKAAQGVVRAELTRMGVWDKTARIRDGSGLSRSNKVPADMMARMLRVDAQPAHPELRGVLTGLPVAGVEGSLRRRFVVADAVKGRGFVRAKTGTLSQVSALAGYVSTADGSVLAYAFLVNKAADYYGTRAWLDRVTATLSSCGCR